MVIMYLTVQYIKHMYTDTMHCIQHEFPKHTHGYYHIMYLTVQYIIYVYVYKDSNTHSCLLSYIYSRIQTLKYLYYLILQGTKTLMFFFSILGYRHYSQILSRIQTLTHGCYQIFQDVDTQSWLLSYIPRHRQSWLLTNISGYRNSTMATISYSRVKSQTYGCYLIFQDTDTYS